MDLGVPRRDFLTGPALQPHAPALDVREGADAVPLELEAPCVVRRRESGREPGHHRNDLVGHRLALRILRRIHAVDHPVLAVGLKEHVAALQALAVEDDHHLPVRPLLDVVGAFVPDQDLARAVVALGDLAMKVDVVERVVLDVDREVVLLRVGRHPFRDRPGDQHAVLLKAEVPVQAPGVVLLNDKAWRPGCFPGHPAARFRGLLEIPFRFVLGQLFGHQ